jgi:hypothetical protein
MKTFIKKYHNQIFLILLTTVVVFLLIKVFTPAPDKSELLKYKLNELDIKIKDLKETQLKLDDSIKVYKLDIERIDKNIDNIRSQKTVVNNYYENKAKEIPGMTNKQVDSSLRKRYNF